MKKFLMPRYRNGCDARCGWMPMARSVVAPLHVCGDARQDRQTVLPDDTRGPKVTFAGDPTPARPHACVSHTEHPPETGVAHRSMTGWYRRERTRARVCLLP